MKRETRYLLILAATALLAVVVQVLSPKPVSWIPTYSPADKNPFGNYVVKNLMDSLFPGQPISTRHITIYELRDTLQPGMNFISLSNEFDADPESMRVLLSKIDSGANAFIGAFYFSGSIADTLRIRTHSQVASSLGQALKLSDTVGLTFATSSREKSRYYYKLENVINYFHNSDSIPFPVHVLARNDWNDPVTLKIRIGKGHLILSTVPLAFTNAYALRGSNYEFIEKTLSHLPVGPVVWTDYYETGRHEPKTPLRFILSKEPLRWAYYLLFSGLVLYVLIEAKRKQRAIPIIRPLRNATLEFVRTIGNMYWQARDYKAIAEKKILFFMDRARTHYFLAAESPDTLARALARKSGNSLEETEHLLALMRVIQTAPVVTPQMLTDLNTRIEQFKF